MYYFQISLSQLFKSTVLKQFWFILFWNMTSWKHQQWRSLNFCLGTRTFYRHTLGVLRKVFSLFKGPGVKNTCVMESSHTWEQNTNHKMQHLNNYEFSLYFSGCTNPDAVSFRCVWLVWICVLCSVPERDQYWDLQRGPRQVLHQMVSSPGGHVIPHQTQPCGP